MNKNIIIKFLILIIFLFISACGDSNKGAKSLATQYLSATSDLYHNKIDVNKYITILNSINVTDVPQEVAIAFQQLKQDASKAAPLTYKSLSEHGLDVAKSFFSGLMGNISGAIIEPGKNIFNTFSYKEDWQKSQRNFFNTLIRCGVSEEWIVKEINNYMK